MGKQGLAADNVVQVALLILQKRTFCSRKMYLPHFPSKASMCWIDFI